MIQMFNWSKILRSKYMKSDKMVPEMLDSRNASSLWREICDIQPSVRKGIRWVCGNGNRIRFWKDRQVVCEHAQCDKAIEIIPRNAKGLCVKEFVGPNGQWLCVKEFVGPNGQWLLPLEVILKVANMIPPSVCGVKDGFFLE